MAPHSIRIIGDPVLTQRTSEVTNVDGAFARLVQDMFVTMYDAPGVGLAAPQIGVQKRFFIFDHDDAPGVIINPVIVESRGEAEFTEGCLSIPGLHFEIMRPAEIHVKGYDLDGNEPDL
ncbi:MAG: peptide deformylase, partial [Actinobacteria bacterium]|nr:peptide deformylase [Actinomycetota bacterium]